MSLGAERVDLPRELNGGIPVNVQDQATEMVVVPLHEELNEGTLLAAPTAIDDMTISLDSGHGAAAGNIICIKEGVRFYVGMILSVPADVATMDTPLDFAFTTSALVCVANANLNVDGSSTPVVARASPPPGVRWDITRLHVNLIDGTVMDSSKFAGISALTKGVVLRKTDGVSKNIACVKSNADLELMASRYLYDDKAPAGTYGFTSNHVFAGQEHTGVVVRLDGSTVDEIQAIIQDDLTDVTLVRIVAIGHVVTD